LYNTENSNNWKNNAFSLGVDYHAPAGLILGVNEEFRLKEDPFGSPEQYALGRVTKRWENDLKTKLGVAWGNNTFRTLLLYNLYKQEYKSDYDFSQNYMNSEYGISAEARFLPRTWGFIRYLYGVREYDSFTGAVVDGQFLAGVADDRNANFKYNQVNVGLSWDPGAKLSGELSVGYMWKKYDNQLDRFGGIREDKNTWVAATTVNFEATATTVIGLTIARTVRDTSADQRTYFEDTGIGVNVRQTILTKFAATAGLNASLNDYNERPGLSATAAPGDIARFNAAESREDKNYMINLGLDYQIQPWMTLGVGYRYNKKTSNYEAFEYVDNQYMANLKIVY
jgi:hypothetical protein